MSWILNYASFLVCNGTKMIFVNHVQRLHSFTRLTIVNRHIILLRVFIITKEHIVNLEIALTREQILRKDTLLLLW